MTVTEDGQIKTVLLRFPAGYRYVVSRYCLRPFQDVRRTEPTSEGFIRCYQVVPGIYASRFHLPRRPTAHRKRCITMPERSVPPTMENGISRDGDATSGTDSRCWNCGSHVTPRFARVMGDNDDQVHACPRCKGFRELSEGAGGNPERTDSALDD